MGHVTVCIPVDNEVPENEEDVEIEGIVDDPENEDEVTPLIVPQEFTVTPLVALFSIVFVVIVDDAVVVVEPVVVVVALVVVVVVVDDVDVVVPDDEPPNVSSLFGRGPKSLGTLGVKLKREQPNVAKLFVSLTFGDTGNNKDDDNDDEHFDGDELFPRLTLLPPVLVDALDDKLTHVELATLAKP